MSNAHSTSIESSPRRTLIVGNLASGKKFLGSKLSDCLRAPLVHLDDIQWERKYDRYRSWPERQRMLEDIVSRDDWVIAGVLYPWAESAIERSERIIILQERFLVEAIRILRRGIAMKLFNPAIKESFKGILGALKHNLIGYHLQEGYGSRTIADLQRAYEDKVIMLRSKAEVKAFLEKACPLGEAP